MNVFRKFVLPVAFLFSILTFSGCSSQMAVSIADHLEERQHLVSAAVTVAVSLYLDQNPEHATRVKEIAEAVRDSSSDTFENLLAIKGVIVRQINWDKLETGQKLAVNTLIDVVIGELHRAAEKHNWGTPEKVEVQVKQIMSYIASTAAIMET